MISPLHRRRRASSTGRVTLTAPATTRANVQIIDEGSAGGVTVPPGIDRVAITQAQWSAGKRELRIEATSSNAGATLTAYVHDALGGGEIGRLTNSGGGRFRGQFTRDNPITITIRSSSGGEASSQVTPV